MSGTWIEALGQALFSTGLGWGIALAVGSYLREYDDVPLGGGVFTTIGKASIGILAAFAIFPIVFAFGLDPAAGAGLTFVSLVQIFPELVGGTFWAILLFLGFFLAAFTSGLVITWLSSSPSRCLATRSCTTSRGANVRRKRPRSRGVTIR